MADYKDYIVRYDIVADVTKAAEGLQSIANIAKEFEGPMNTLKTAITQVNQSVFQLKQNSQIKFAPEISTSQFSNQLRKMVTETENAAAKMHATIFNALSGNPLGKKVAQKGGTNGFQLAKGSQALKSQFDSNLKLIEEQSQRIQGLQKTLKTSLTAAQKENAEQSLRSAQLIKKGLQAQNKEIAAALREAEETERQATKAATTASKTKTTKSKSTSASTASRSVNSQSTKLTNVTPAVIREWKKAFGDAKSKALTVNIKGNATGAGGALTIIEQIQASLKALQSQGTFNINPILNTEGFAAAEAQLKRLADLSATVVAPFTPKDTKAKTGKPSNLVSTLTKDEKAKLTNAQKQIKDWNKKIAPIQSRLDANRAIPEDQRTPAIKGQITRDTKTLAAYQANRAEQENIVRTLQGKSTATAQTAAKTAKPLALDIVGNLSKINVTAKAPVVPIVGEITKIQHKVTEAIPVNVKISGEQVAASLKAIKPTPVLDVKVHLMTEGVQQQLQALSGQTKPIGTATPKATTSATPTATPHPVYTPPTLTAAEEKQLNTLAAKAGTLSTAQEKAAKAMGTAKAKLDKSGGSTRAFERYMAAQREYGDIRKEYLDVQKQLKPLMFKQFQSTAQRALTDEEIVKGIGAQNIVNQLAAKKRLNAAQKTQLAEANQTLAALRAPATPPTASITNTPTPSATQPTKVKKTAAKNTIAATVDTKNIVSQIQNIPRQTIPVAIKLMWERGAVGRQEQLKKITANIPPVTLNFKTAAAIAKLEEFVAKVRAASPQNINLTATGVATKAAPATTVPPVAPIMPPTTGGKTQKSQKQSGHTGHQPLTPKQYRDQLGAHLAKSGILPPNYATQIADQQRKRGWQLDQMKRDATAAFAQKTPYELAEEERMRKSAQTNHKGKPSKSNVQKAARLQAQAQNAMLPFAQSNAQLNMLTKHRRYFRQAVATTGIMPTPGMEAPQMLKYLQGVSTQMQKASVAVPWTLQSQINKLEGNVAKANGVGQPTQYRGTGMAPMGTGQPKPFFERSRKWAYPLTGNTSFGARTPIAVDMAKGMGVMFAVGGAISAIGSSFSQAMEYQNTMRTTQAILQNGTDSYSQNSFKNMEATVRNVGVKTKFSAPEVANAARFLAMAGYDIEGINSAIRPIADLALIGDSDLGETADKMTNIMTTFKIAPDRMREAANIMATTVTRTNTDLMMLAESAHYGGGVAQMYGHNDPNLFADTIALFGVMGNAGIQGSSAGTSLRMMYQNIFNPNKKQAALLDLLESKYHVSTTLANGQKRSMADIIIDMANKIPADEMPDIVGKLFRITAQPGANAALISAMDIATQESGGDANMATNLVNETNAFVDKISGKNSKSQLSALASLIQANRNSINGNISGAIAEEKQNTISGLWAQVTSTFTEGIVQAFENRQGGFEEMLKKLRDYLAKPETIQMIQNLLDMIIEIGKVMAWFVKIWASLYNTAPGLIKTWVTAQMMFTQFGSLIAPIYSLMGAFTGLKNIIISLTGISAVGGATMTRNMAGRVVAGGVANAVITNAPFIVGSGKWGTKKVIRGNIATRAHNALAANAILAGELALSGANKQTTLGALNQETRQHYAAVRERAMRIYGPARAGRAFRAAATAVPTMASFAPMFGGLKSMLMGLLTGLAKAAGFLVNPVTLAVGAVAGLGYGLYKLKQRIDGTSEAQQRARVQANKAADQTHRELTKAGQWYWDMMNEDIPEATPVISSIDTTQIEKYNADKQKFNQFYATIFNDFSKDASKQQINDVTTKWRNTIAANPAYSLAIGNANNYDFSKKHKQLEYNPYNDATNGAVALWNLWHREEDNAINQRNGMVQDALMIEGANDFRTQQAIREIVELRQKYLAGESTYKSESEYQQAAFAIRDKFMSQFTAKLPSAGMTPEQFQQTSNRSVYDQYQLGAQNLLDATINGQMGTLVGKMNAYQWLSDAKNRAQLYTAEWYNAISNIISDYHVIYNAISADGQQQTNIELILSTLPNGQLNFTSILDQIRAKVTNFNMTLQGFTDIIGAAYKLMAEAGAIDIQDVKSLQNQIYHQLNGAKYNDETPRQYWAQWIANNDNSEWIKAGVTEEQYVDFMMGRSGKTLNLGNRIVSRSEEQNMMYSNISRKTAKTIIDQNKDLISKSKQLGNNNPNPQDPPAPKSTPAAAQDQKAYASHYDRAAARPTQVVFNINNLANFDRTTVASSAEERDLMATMEDKIVGAVYQMFAEASNQAHRVMDIT